jgi:hypothetical protein
MRRACAPHEREKNRERVKGRRRGKGKEGERGRKREGGRARELGRAFLLSPQQLLHLLRFLLVRTAEEHSDPLGATAKGG